MVINRVEIVEEREQLFAQPLSCRAFASQTCNSTATSLSLSSSRAVVSCGIPHPRQTSLPDDDEEKSSQQSALCGRCIIYNLLR